MRRSKLVITMLCIIMVLSCVGKVDAKSERVLSVDVVSSIIENYRAINNMDAKESFDIAKAKNAGVTDAIVTNTHTVNATDGIVSETYSYIDKIFCQENEAIVAKTTVTKITDSSKKDSILPIKPGFGVMGGSKTEYDYDSSYSVYAKVTVYYDTATASDGMPLYRFNRVDVSNRVDDSSVSITNQHLRYGTSGYQEGGGWYSQTYNKYPSGTGWSYPTGLNAYVRDSFGGVGARYTLTLRRQSSYTWNLVIEDYVFSKGITY